MRKLWNWLSAVPRRRVVQALTLAIVAAVSVALPALGGSSATLVRAQNDPPPLHAHAGHKILLTGSVPNALRKAKRLGVESGKRQLDLVISLQLSDVSGLATLLATQQNPTSPQYHQYLTSKEFIARFAPSAQAVNAVRQFLTSQGLKVTSVSANRTLIHARGTVAQANRAFGVTITTYQLGKRTVYGPDRAPQIPDALATYVLNISGLDNVLVAKPLLQDETQATTTKTTQASKMKAATGAGPGGGYTPAQLLDAYDVTNLYNAGGTGSGQRLAVFELAPYIPSDLTHYQSTYFLPSGGLNNHSVDGASPTCTTAGSACDNGSGIIEADLDVEVVAALAPSSTLDVYTGPNSSQGLLDTYNQIVLDNTDNVTTTSWGLCEPLTGDDMLDSLDQIFAQAASQGQTIAAAAGDAGSDDCSRAGYSTGAPTVDSPASDPYVLGVGGTTLNMSGGGVTYGSESTWNSLGGAGGGGISSYFMQPSWQVGGGVVNTYSTGEREVPDVAADADPNTGYSVYCSSNAECNGIGWIEVGGTSAAAPLWAGVLTDINTYLTAHTVAPLGWANQTLYTLFSNNQTYTPYHDITTGNNDIDFTGTSYAGDYPATACYDQATGVGSPDAWNIARDAQGGVSAGGGGPCPNTAPTTTQLVQDGSFESAAAAWTEYSSGAYTLIVPFGGHTGKQSVFACEYPDCDDRVSQTITIPATIHQATLTFWVSPQSAFPFYLTNPPCVDHFYATLATPDGTVASGGGQVMNVCPNQAVSSYQYEKFDVTSLLEAHAGQQLILSFRGTTTNEAVVPGFYTGWLIDDVSLTVS